MQSLLEVSQPRLQFTILVRTRFKLGFDLAELFFNDGGFDVVLLVSLMDFGVQSGLHVVDSGLQLLVNFVDRLALSLSFMESSHQLLVFPLVLLLLHSPLILVHLELPFHVHLTHACQLQAVFSILDHFLTTLQLLSKIETSLLQLFQVGLQYCRLLPFLVELHRQMLHFLPHSP